MAFNPGTLLSALAERISPPPGRRQRRLWTGNGRAHIEVKGVDRPENADLARKVENALAHCTGVHWAEVNPVLGRVIIAFDGSQLGADDLTEVIEGVEEAYGVAAERFPQDRPEHPADAETLQRQVYAIGAEIAGLGMALAGRAIRANPLLSEAASVVSLIDATPAVRRRLEGRLGQAATDLGLAVGSAVAQGLAQGPFGLLVDITHRGLRLDEARARREAWQRREPELTGRREGDPPSALNGTRRPVPLPPGPVESYADHKPCWIPPSRRRPSGGTGGCSRPRRTTSAARRPRPPGGCERPAATCWRCGVPEPCGGSSPPSRNSTRLRWRSPPPGGWQAR